MSAYLKAGYRCLLILAAFTVTYAHAQDYTHDDFKIKTIDFPEVNIDDIDAPPFDIERYRKEAEKAADKYPMAVVNDHLRLDTPRRIYDGKYYGSTPGGIRIGQVTVPWVDVPDDKKYLFSEEENKKFKKEFIAAYIEKKEKLHKKRINELYLQQKKQILNQYYISFKDRNGIEYDSVVVREIRPNGICIKSERMNKFIHFRDLPEDIQNKYGYSAGLCSAYDKFLEKRQQILDTRQQYAKEALYFNSDGLHLGIGQDVAPNADVENLSDIYLTLGKLAYKQNEFDDAIKYFSIAINKNSSRLTEDTMFVVYQKAGIDAYNRNDLNNAMDYLQRAGQIDNTDKYVNKYISLIKSKLVNFNKTRRARLYSAMVNTPSGQEIQFSGEVYTDYRYYHYRKECPRLKGKMYGKTAKAKAVKKGLKPCPTCGSENSWKVHKDYKAAREIYELNRRGNNNATFSFETTHDVYTGKVSTRHGYSGTSSAQQQALSSHIYGKIKIVNHDEDVRVRIVTSNPDIEISICNIATPSKGEWQFVEYGEKYKIKFVGEGQLCDFTVKFIK